MLFILLLVYAFSIYIRSIPPKEQIIVETKIETIQETVITEQSPESLKEAEPTIETETTEPIIEETTTEKTKEVIETEQQTTEPSIQENQETIKEEVEEKTVSFKDIREDFWFTDDGFIYGGFYALPDYLKIMPDFNNTQDYPINIPIKDWFKWLYGVNGSFFKFFGEILTYETDGTIYVKGAETKISRDKNIWTQEQIERITDSLVFQGITEEEAVERISAYIINNFSYISRGWEDGMLYNMLKDKQGHCEAYSRLFKEMCNYIGIECKYVEGYATEHHAWNKVKINNKWYYVDLTWADTGSPEYRKSESLWDTHTVWMEV